MPTALDAALQSLAEQTAATVHATVRRWWRDPADGMLLRIAADRTFVGARPIALHFTVRLKTIQPEVVAGRIRMQVGVSLAPPPVPGRPSTPTVATRGAASRARRPARATGATPRKANGTARARVRAKVSAPQLRKRARPAVGRAQRQVTPRATGQKKPRRSSRG